MEKYEVYENEPVMFHNRAFSCIGTGRMDLALHKEYLDQLALVQKKIGFDYIRGHGLFCKDMAIYQEFITPDGSVKEEYNFTYLDMVMDAYQDLKIRPFIELGFMPEQMASGDETVFYWKGNITISGRALCRTRFVILCSVMGKMRFCCGRLRSGMSRTCQGFGKMLTDRNIFIYMKLRQRQ